VGRALRPLLMRHAIWGGVLAGCGSAVVIALVLIGGPAALLPSADPNSATYYSYTLWSAALFVACFAVAGSVVGLISSLLAWGVARCVTSRRPESWTRAVVVIVAASLLGAASAAAVLVAFDLDPSVGALWATCVAVGTAAGALGASWALWMSQGKGASLVSTST